jgi:hypothetical protein
MGYVTDDHLQCARPPVAWLPLDEGKLETRPCQPSFAPGSCLRRANNSPPLRMLWTETPISLVPHLLGLATHNLQCTTMEPPAKRLRIMQSVDVDETNPDYINTKKKHQEKFKSSLESIFAKYENMHESMSDEVDMKEGKVVVDRGHYRRLARQAAGPETLLLNSIGLGVGPEPESGEDEEQNEEDSEDELAPTQTVASRSVQKGRSQQRSSVVNEAQLLPSHSGQLHAPRTASIPVAIAQPGIQSIPQTPNPTANLLQYVQFPQTPAGQQAQTSFYATLAQTINQAVQQAVAPLFSSILPNTPNVQLPFPNALPLQTTPVSTADKIAPAKDPKWFFPPLSNEADIPDVAHSTPVPAPIIEPARQNESTQEEPCIPETVPPSSATETNTQIETISAAALALSDDLFERAGKASRRTSPRVEIQHRRSNRAKYFFTEEDDIYICKRRVLQDWTWKEIRDSQEKWKNWPPRTFSNRWNTRLKGTDLHMKGDPTTTTEQDGPQTFDDELAALPLHHLPTPSSSGYEDNNTPVVDVAADTHMVAPSSSAHFDEDERDLLSLAGVELDDEHSQVDNVEEEAFFPDADEIILPSVEQTSFVDEDALQQGLLDGSGSEEPEVKTPVKIKVENSVSAPSGRRKRKQAPVAYQALPDTDTEMDDGDRASSGLGSSVKGSLACDVCKATFKTIRNLQRHQANPRSMHDKARAKSASIDLVGDDELQVTEPTTPQIKREFSTPPPTSFLFSTPAPQSSQSRPELASSGAQSASGLSRNAYLKQVKSSWTKKSTPTSKTVNKRRSFHTMPRKRDWAEIADSDDELA